MTAIETCRCCGDKAELDQGICTHCELAYGPRVARLLARCLADADFASACLARLPEAARLRFATLLSARCLKTTTTLSGPGLRYTRVGTSARERVSA